MSEVLARIESGARSRGENLLFVTKSMGVSPQEISRRDFFLTVSNTHFDVYPVKGAFSVHAYSWLNLTHISVMNSTIYLEFGTKKIAFKSPEIPAAYKEIMNVLPRILKPAELYAAGVSLTPEMPLPNANSAFLRLKQRVKYSRSPQKERAATEIVELLRYSPYVVDLVEIDEVESALPLFADILPLLPNVRSVSVECTPFIDALGLMHDVTTCSGCLEHLEIHGKPNPKTFDGFLSALSANTETRVDSLTFNDADLDEDELSSVLSFMRARKCASLGLINSVSQSSAIFFESRFISDSSFSDLIELRLEKMSGINMRTVLPALCNISLLSLANCNIDLNKFFSQLANLDFPYLTALNLSGNKCSAPLSSAHKLPDNISTLMVDDVSWCNDGLLSLFKLLKANSKSNFKLSVSRAAISRKEWNTVFSFIASEMRTDFLFSLVWDGNRFSNTLLEFFKKQVSLEFLSMNGCFSNKELDTIELFASFISQNSTIKSLSISGDEDRYFGASIKHIIAAIKKRETKLEFLDISNSKCGDEGIEEMKTFLTAKNPPHVIVMDGSDPIRSKSITNFLTDAVMKSSDICISFPKHDLDYLARLKRLPHDQYSRIKEMYMIPENSNPDSTFGKPFAIFIEDKSQKFPRYVTRTYSTPKRKQSHKKMYVQTALEGNLLQTPKTPPCVRKTVVHEDRKIRTLDPDDFVQFGTEKKSFRSRRRSYSMSKAKKKQQFADKIVTPVIKDRMNILSDNGSFYDKHSMSNIAAVSTNGAPSIVDDYYNAKKEEEDKYENPYDIKKEGSVPRLVPNSSLSKLTPQKRERPLLMKERCSLPVKNPKMEKKVETIQIREPQKPPDSGSPRRTLLQNAEHIKPQQQARNSSDDDSDSLLYTLSTNMYPSPIKIDDFDHHFCNELDTIKGDWEFPIPHVGVNADWHILNEKFSMEEVLKELSNVPHIRY